jgi:uncharacterized protein (TIGR02265 family)
VVERLVFSNSFEALQRALGPTLTERTRQRYRELGVDFTRLESAYPLATWVKALTLAAELLGPGRSMEEATYIVGTRILTSYAETTVGKALMALLRVIGPKRGMSRITKTLRTAGNYVETRATELTPSRFEVWVNHVNFPHYYRGLFVAGLELAGGAGAKAELVSHQPAGEAVFILSWQE